MLALLTPEAFREFAQKTTAELRFFAPELTLIVFACALLLADLFVERRKSKDLAFLALLGVMVSLFFTLRLLKAPPDPGEARIFQDTVVVDTFSSFFKVIFLVGTAITIALAYISRDLEDRPMGEFFAIMLSCVLGMFLMAGATDLILIAIAIELLSIPSYVLVGWRKASRESSEAALKYVVYGSVSSGIMIYGFSLLFGMIGSTKIADLIAYVSSGQANLHALALAAFLCFAGFGYKMAAVPMQFWAPDVYQGAPTSVTAWLSVTSKAAGIAVFIRFLDVMGLGQPATDLTQKGSAFLAEWRPQLVSLLALLSAVTMTLGNLAALFQTNVKRLLAYSSVAHVGYILMGVATFAGASEAAGGDGLAAATGIAGYAGWRAVAFYLVAYLFMNLGAFTCVIVISNQVGSENIDDYRGLGVRAPLLGVTFSIFLVSLIGIPPTAGFVGKFQLFMVAIQGGLVWLTVVAAVNTAISAYYYARILKNMYLETPADEAPLAVPFAGNALALVHMALVLLLGVFFNPLLAWTQRIGLHPLGRS